MVRVQLPKIGEHFSREMINPSMYASQWFITVFSYSFPFPLALRIWDVFLYEVRCDLFVPSAMILCRVCQFVTIHMFVNFGFVPMVFLDSAGCQYCF